MFRVVQSGRERTKVFVPAATREPLRILLGTEVILIWQRETPGDSGKNAFMDACLAICAAYRLTC